MTLSVALDSRAVLAWLNGEPAGQVVRDLLRWASGDAAAAGALGSLLPLDRGDPQVLMSIVNLGEVYYILGRRLGEETASLRVNQIRMLPIAVLPADERTVFDAASIKCRYRLSFANAFAVATASLNGSILLTGDPEIKAVDGVEVCYIGK